MSVDPDACTNPKHRYQAHANNTSYEALMKELTDNGAKNDHGKMGEICVLCAYEIGKKVGYTNAMKVK